MLAPLNSEIQKLPRKPWEDLRDYETLGEQAYDGSGGEERAHKNLRRFVEAHIVPKSPWKEGEKVSSLGGGQVWWEERNGGKFVGSFSKLSLFLAVYWRFTDDLAARFIPEILRFQKSLTRLQMEKCGC